MTEKEISEARRIRSVYEEKKLGKLDELRALDRKAKLPALIFAYTFGIIGALVLGFGMCMAMKVIFDSVIIGVVVGALGIISVVVNYPVYKRILAFGIRKYASRINALSDEILEN